MLNDKSWNHFKIDTIYRLSTIQITTNEKNICKKSRLVLYRHRGDSFSKLVCYCIQPYIFVLKTISKLKVLMTNKLNSRNLFYFHTFSLQNKLKLIKQKRIWCILFGYDIHTSRCSRLWGNVKTYIKRNYRTKVN